MAPVKTLVCECGNEPSGSIKGGEILYWLRNYWVLKDDCAQCS